MLSSLRASSSILGKPHSTAKPSMVVQSFVGGFVDGEFWVVEDPEYLCESVGSVRGHPQLYVPLYIPYLLFIFHLHFALLTYLFVIVWLPP